MTVKQIKKFTPVFEEYLRLYEHFHFSGIEEKVLEDPNGVSALEAFFEKESNGKNVPTSEPELLKKVLKAKGSCNLHIDMYAQGRVDCTLPGIEFSFRVVPYHIIKYLIKVKGINKVKEMRSETLDYKYNLPLWFIKAVENNKCKYYSNEFKS